MGWWSNFKNHVLAQPEPVRRRYVRICTGVIMALIVALWIAWALVLSEPRQDATPAPAAGASAPAS